jgi:flagellar hook-associated protein 1 FlgK
MNVPNIGLNGALWMGSQALSASQVAIQTTGNNIANINTPGYARQRANFVTNQQTGIGGELDNGVTISSIQSLRSTMLDSLVQSSLGQQGYADNLASQASTVQDSLGEQFSTASSSTTSSTTQAGSGAIQTALTNFFSAFQTLANSPTSSSARAAVSQDAQTLASALNGAYTRLQTTQSQIAGDATSLTTQINQLSSQIASLNQQIQQSEAASGTTANNLRDTRETAIESLSSLVNVNATAQSDGTVTVTLADAPNVTLVSGYDSNGVGTTQSLSATYNANAATPLTISASTAGALGTGVPSAGSLGADLDAANNIIGSPGASGNSGLLGQLDSVTSALISAVNTQNKAGYDANGNAGGAFFTGTGAASIAVSTTITSNPSTIATASAANSPLDGSNALAMSQLQGNANILPAFQTMVSNLGETVSNATSQQTTQDAITKQVKDQRDSVSGVSLDQEMTNLINFQQSYSASARFINTIAGLYSTLINAIPAN